MTRVFAYLFATLIVLAGVGQAQAQVDTRELMGGGPGFFGSSGSSSIRR